MSKKPDNTFKKPDSVFKKPASVFKKPDSVFKKPDSVFKKPQMLFRKPRPFSLKRQLTGLGSLFSGTNNNTSASNHQEAITNMGDQRVPRNKSSAVDTYPEEDSFSIPSSDQSHNIVRSEIDQHQLEINLNDNDDSFNNVNANQLRETQYASQERSQSTPTAAIFTDETTEEINDINCAITSQIAARDTNINDVTTINASEETIQDFTKNINTNNNVTLNTLKQDINSGLATNIIISNQDSTEDIIQDINIVSGTTSTKNDTSSNVNDVIVNNTQDKVNPITENFTINTNQNTCQDLIKNTDTSDTANENNYTLNDYHAAVSNVTKDDDTIISSTKNTVTNTSQTITEDIIEDNIANPNNACQQNTQIATLNITSSSNNNQSITTPNIIKEDTRFETSKNQDINDNIVNNKQNSIGQAVSSVEEVKDLIMSEINDVDTIHTTKLSETKPKPIAQPKKRRGRPIKAKNSGSTTPTAEKTTQEKTRAKRPLSSNRAQKRRKINGTI